MGEIGIDRKEFLFELKRWEISAIVKGYRNRERLDWETTRWQTYLILSALGAKYNSCTDLVKFPWDYEISETITPDEAADMVELLNNINKKNEKD